jgi:ribonuclease Z
LIVAIALTATISGPSLAQTASDPVSFRVTLLGTGTPTPRVDRLGPSTLVQAGNQRLLFDAGRGVTIRLTQSGVPLRDVDAVFLTHLHSDHVNGLSDLWLTGWLPPAYGRRELPLRVYGPSGTRDMMSHLEQAHREDVRIRIADEDLSKSGATIDATDVAEGLVYERDGVRVTAFDVDHGELIKPALGYRVDFGGRSVVLSGDTRFSANLIAHAKGADVIIHEVMAATESLLASDAGRRIMAHHSSPEDAARVFEAIGPRLAVYSHVILGGVTEDELMRRTRMTYRGRLEVGSDLMTIDVTDVSRITRADQARD